LLVPNTFGNIASPLFGPAKQWEKLYWNGASLENPSTDHATVDVIGVKPNGVETVLYSGIRPEQQEYDVSSTNAQDYPYIKLRLNTIDSVHGTPYQLHYWRLTYTAKPEGALAPNLYLSIKDTVEIGEALDIKIAFKNVTETSFDSLKVKMIVTDANNVKHVLPVPRHKPLNGNDTIHIQYKLDTRLFAGLNSLYVDVNPDNDQLEQYHFNNFAYRSFFVNIDSLNPMLDVTFDNMHILNNDIVSSKPSILIKLIDEARWRLLDDTSLIKVQVKFPGNVTHATISSTTIRSVSRRRQTHPIIRLPLVLIHIFTEDGIYELIISGKDKSGNVAGSSQYRVAFEVINKP
jgi:hypothetical protein